VKKSQGARGETLRQAKEKRSRRNYGGTRALDGERREVAWDGGAFGWSKGRAESGGTMSGLGSLPLSLIPHRPPGTSLTSSATGVPELSQ
jgi:hypothetical protein